GGRAFRITPADPSLSSLAAAIEGMEQKSLAREFSYRRKERFQIPLAAGVLALGLALLLPLPPLGRRRAVAVGSTSPGAAAAAVVLALALAPAAPARSQAPAAPP